MKHLVKLVFLSICYLIKNIIVVIIPIYISYEFFMVCEQGLVSVEGVIPVAICSFLIGVACYMALLKFFEYIEQLFEY